MKAVHFPMMHCMRSTPMCRGCGERLEGVYPPMIHSTGFTSLYGGRGESLKSMDFRLHAQLAMAVKASHHSLHTRRPPRWCPPSIVPGLCNNGCHNLTLTKFTAAPVSIRTYPFRLAPLAPQCPIAQCGRPSHRHSRNVVQALLPPALTNGHVHAILSLSHSRHNMQHAMHTGVRDAPLCPNVLAHTRGPGLPSILAMATSGPPNRCNTVLFSVYSSGTP